MNKFRVGDLRVRETGAEDEMDSLLSNKEPLESGSRDDSISDENEKAELCGVGAWTPKLMQKLNNSDCALLFLSLLVCFEGMVLYGEAPTTLSSIETRYDFKSWVAGFLLSMSDVGIALTLIPISYLGSNVNKCQWIAYGAVSFSIGCLLYSAPHFLSDSYQLSSNLTLVQNGHLCGISDNDSFNYTFNEDDDDLTRRSGHCDFVQDSKTGFFAKGVYFLLFAAGRFLQGAGCVPLYVLAIVYLDENVLPSRSSLYMGIFYCLSLVGPTGGYIIGALFLRVYVNVDKVFRDDSFEVSQDNPLWIGAWWAGYLLGAVLVMLCAVPVSLYPKRLPGYKEVQAQRVSEVHKDESELERTLLSSDEDHTTKLRQVWGATKDLIVGNRPFLLLSLSNSCDSFLIFGMAAFFPKYLESQFNLTASSAALMAAAVAVPSAGGGTFLGGWVVERFDMSATQIISFCKWVTFLSVPLLLVFLVPCGNQDYAGINYDYPFDETNLELDPNHNFESRFLSYCNSECNCMDEDYFPLCGIDSVQYYSPCHAGCVSDVDPGSKMAIETYTNCSCVGASKTAKPGGHSADSAWPPAESGTGTAVGAELYLWLHSWSSSHWTHVRRGMCAL
ncbi:solute carrier organic anion transporter family member 4A1-like isoform X2 [Symsagittifera roscoffensis]|uniref:solute carrier organic anion transporter family member 4A1-like isoform X2 n=1 Tax=Symsagittifera roscoffensis TaxID=84072 RepID=UPI00307CB05F